MNNIYADFISPQVSRLHYSDPCIDFIDYHHIFDSSSGFSLKYNEIFTDDVISHLHQISSGHQIEINEEQSVKMRFIALLLENNELFKKIDELFPIKIKKSNFEKYIGQLQLFQYLTQESPDFDYSLIIDLISSHFYSLNPNKLFQLPKSILYSIISNKYLKLKSEDSLLDFIEQIFANSSEDEKEDSDFGLVSFYEQIQLNELSERKFVSFIQKLNSSQISHEMWTKLKKCFYMNLYSLEGLRSERYSHHEFEFDENERFKGIIDYLTDESGGNVSENGTVIVTSSSTFNNRYPEYVVDLEDNNHYFMSDDEKNSWIKFDFGERKVRPTSYSIRSRHDFGRGNHHLKNWCIEGSNSDLDDDWKVLDTRNAISSLDNANAAQTFCIQEKMKKDECYRYLRLRETGVNTGGFYHIALSALEFFGFLI